MGDPNTRPRNLFRVHTSDELDLEAFITAQVEAWKATGRYAHRVNIALLIGGAATTAGIVPAAAATNDLTQQILDSLADGEDAEGIITAIRDL